MRRGPFVAKPQARMGIEVESIDDQQSTFDDESKIEDQK